MQIKLSPKNNTQPLKQTSKSFNSSTLFHTQPHGQQIKSKDHILISIPPQRIAAKSMFVKWGKFMSGDKNLSKSTSPPVKLKSVEEGGGGGLKTPASSRKT